MSFRLLDQVFPRSGRGAAGGVALSMEGAMGGGVPMKLGGQILQRI